METKAVRLYGTDDLRLETLELPEIKENEILMRVVTDCLCSSTLKAVKLGEKHKHIPNDVSEAPIIVGHEMCGEIVALGRKLEGRHRVGEKIVIHPDLRLETGHAPGYSFKFIGGAATYAIVPEEVIENNCVLSYGEDSYFVGSLVEPLASTLRAYKSFYHTDHFTYEIVPGIKKGGKLAIIGGAGAMGLAAIEIAKKCLSVSEITVIDVSDERLEFVKRRSALTDSETNSCNITYLNTVTAKNYKERLMELSSGGYDDVLVLSPKPEAFILAQNICRDDGCINLFAETAQIDAYAQTNLYKLHYNRLHVVATIGSTTDDAKEIVSMINEKIIVPEILISHILGMGEYVETVMNLDKTSGAKKVCYTGIDIPYIAIDELAFWGESDAHYATLAEIVKNNGGLWCAEAEKYLIENAPRI